MNRNNFNFIQKLLFIFVGMVMIVSCASSPPKLNLVGSTFNLGGDWGDGVNFIVNFYKDNAFNGELLIPVHVDNKDVNTGEEYREMRLDRETFEGTYRRKKSKVILTGNWPEIMTRSGVKREGYNFVFIKK